MPPPLSAHVYEARVSRHPSGCQRGACGLYYWTTTDNCSAKSTVDTQIVRIGLYAVWDFPLGD